MENYNESINSAKQWFLRQIKQIENYPSEAHRFIILISTIECFAQQSSGFSHQNMHYFVFFDRCANALLAVSAAGGARWRFPTSHAHRSHNPEL